MSAENKYCVIGGGPSGLAACKNLKDHKIDFDAFEASRSVGGLWNINNENSTVYKSAHLISSKRMTEFKDFPMKDDVADYPNHEELNKYFQDYAKHFNLLEHFTFNTKVDGVTKDNEAWKVTLNDGSSKVYKGVIIANGTLSHPNIPEFKGSFDGEMMHSKFYKSSDVFAHKRVLIVGAGNSGCDIAVDAIHRAKKVDISMRRGYHFVPKYVFGKPADTLGGLFQLPPFLKQKVDKRLLKLFTGDPQRLGFPEPDHKLYEAHPIVNSLVLYHAGHGDIHVKKDIDKLDGKKVVFKDGSEEEYDLILLATGYKLNYPFIDKKELNWDGPAPKLYLNIFHPEYNNLFMMGMVEASGLGWEGRNEQAKLIAKFIHGINNGKSSAKEFAAKKKQSIPDMNGGFKYIKLDRMAYYVHKDTYRKALTDAIIKL